MTTKTFDIADLSSADLDALLGYTPEAADPYADDIAAERYSFPFGPADDIAAELLRAPIAETAAPGATEFEVARRFRNR